MKKQFKKQSQLSKTICDLWLGSLDCYHLAQDKIGESNIRHKLNGSQGREEWLQKEVNECVNEFNRENKKIKKLSVHF